MSKNESGSIHAIIIGFLTIGLVGAIGFIFWQNFINKSSSNSSASLNKQSSDKAAVVTKRYCAKQEKVCFNYPSRWTLDDKSAVKSTVVGADNIKLTSPDKIVVLRFVSGIGPNDGMGPGPRAEGSIDVVSATKLPLFRQFVANQYSTQSAYVSEAIESIVETEFTNPYDLSTMFAKEKGYVPSILLSNSLDLSKVHTYKSQLGLIGMGAIMQGKYALWDKSVSSDVGGFLFGTVMPYDDMPKMYATSKEAKDMFKTESFKQAKDILLSVRYEQ